MESFWDKRKKVQAGVNTVYLIPIEELLLLLLINQCLQVII